MEKKYIQFQKSMTADKRAKDFCYLRHNVYPEASRGMYPARGFQEVRGVPAGANVKAHIGSQVFIQNGNDVEIYVYSGGSSLGSVDYTVAGEHFAMAVDGNDGVHWIDKDGDVYKNDVKIADESGSGNQAIIFDGLYYFFFTGNKIFRQLKSDVATEVFGETGDSIARPFSAGNEIIYVTVDGLDFTVNIWGKDSATLLDRRIIIHNAKLLGIGEVDGKIILVKGVGNSTNVKESYGNIEVTLFTGDSFELLNKIKSGENLINSHAQNIGNGMMLVALYANENAGGDQNENSDLYHNFVLKIRNDGNIETIFDTTVSDDDRVESVSVQYDYVTVGVRDSKFYRNVDNGSDYSTDFTDTTYITNFLDFTGSKHKLGGFGVSFEKIFEGATNSEKLKVSYRVSERDDWVEIDTITKAKIKDNIDARQSQTVKDTEAGDDNTGLNLQHYEMTRMPDKTAFTEYYEIQFKLESKQGFSVIDFWYYTDKQKRITRK